MSRIKQILSDIIEMIMNMIDATPKPVRYTLHAIWLVPFFIFLIVYMNIIAPLYERITGREPWNPK
jgi:hypothetical protein